MVVKYSGASDFVEGVAGVVVGVGVGAGVDSGRDDEIGGRGSGGRREDIFWTYR